MNDTSHRGRGPVPGGQHFREERKDEEGRKGRGKKEGENKGMHGKGQVQPRLKVVSFQAPEHLM